LFLALSVSLIAVPSIVVLRTRPPLPPHDGSNPFGSPCWGSGAGNQEAAVPGTAHDEDKPGLGRLVHADGMEYSNADGRSIVAELQEALLPTALPVLPRARIAARYLVAGQEQAAGGDWFDAIPLDGGAVALVVGDVVGHGLSASAAMGQLRAVLAELLAAEPDLRLVLGRTDAFAARM